MQNICRTCLTPTGGKTTYSISATLCLNESEEMISVKKMLRYCVPEMALDMIQESVVCHSCLVALSDSFQFRTNCLKNEKRLQNFISSSTKNLNFGKIFSDENEDPDLNLSKIHTCCVCQKTFVSEIFLKKHMKTHENQIKYECGVCEKIFTEPVRLKVHILTHREKEQQNGTSSQSEADFDDSVSSKIAPFMLATSQNFENSGNFEVVNVLENKDDQYKAETRKIWTDEETLHFLNLCKRHVKDMYQGPKKSLWSLISRKLASKNIHVSLDQCESKWKNLIRTYNLVKAKLSKDPKAQTKFHYLFEFDELMSMLDKVRPRTKSECDVDDFGDDYHEGFHGFDGFDAGNDDTFIINYDDRGSDGEGDMDHNDEIALNDEDDTEKMWTSEETLALLDAIRQKKEEMGNEKSPLFWDAIANDMSKYNYHATPHQCDSKWKSLKRTYRKVKERILESKVTTTKFSYFSLVDEIIHNEDIYEIEMSKNAKSLQRILESTLDEDEDDDDDSREIFAKKIKLDEDNDTARSS